MSLWQLICMWNQELLLLLLRSCTAIVNVLLRIRFCAGISKTVFYSAHPWVYRSKYHFVYPNSMCVSHIWKRIGGTMVFCLQAEPKQARLWAKTGFLFCVNPRSSPCLPWILTRSQMTPRSTVTCKAGWYLPGDWLADCWHIQCTMAVCSAWFFFRVSN